jgi:hypothetical protein
LREIPKTGSAKYCMTPFSQPTLHSTEKKTIFPLAFTHPIRAEMEIEKFARERFADHFDKEHECHGEQILFVYQPLHWF